MTTNSRLIIEIEPIKFISTITKVVLESKRDTVSGMKSIMYLIRCLWPQLLMVIYFVHMEAYQKNENMIKSVLNAPLIIYQEMFITNK